MLQIAKYSNGNAEVKLYSDGTRIIEAKDDLKLDYPLNIDVRLSRRCALGMNPKTGKAVCTFCHESATTDGKDATKEDIDFFFYHLSGLPEGTELALGVNQFTIEVQYFLQEAFLRGYVVNVTVNQGTVRRDERNLFVAIDLGWIRGLGLSYRKGMIMPRDLIEYKNTVFHVIAGIDTIDDVKTLQEYGIKKILVLGEKDFGFNLGKVQIKSANHMDWLYRIHELFDLFDVVSFDNLALEQLKVKRFVKNWEEMYQHEFSFYANIVDRTFSESSRSPETVPMTNVKNYFKIRNQR